MQVICEFPGPRVSYRLEIEMLHQIVLILNNLSDWTASWVFSVLWGGIGMVALLTRCPSSPLIPFQNTNWCNHTVFSQLNLLTRYHFLVSDHRCNPGWRGNRCHVKEKPLLSSSTPKSEDTQQSNERNTPPCSSLLNCVTHIYWMNPLKLIKGVSLDLDAVYVGIAIGLVLLIAGVAICILALCKKRCSSMWVLTTVMILWLLFSFWLLLNIMLLMRDAVVDDECLFFVGSTESSTWTTWWWITQPLTGEQRSARRSVQSIIRQFSFSIIRLTFIQ